MSSTGNKKKSSLLGKILKICLFFFCVVLIVAAFFYKDLVRLYNVINLFEADVVIENFRNMDSMFEIRTVQKGNTVHRFDRREAKLPKSYVYKGKTKDLQNFLDTTWTTGLIVIKDENIAFEKYYRGNNESTRCISWSVAKSFVSALIGIAVHEGVIKDIRQPVTDYVPFLKGTGYDGVPIKDVLQMSSGIRFNEEYGDFFSDINRMGRAIALRTSLDDFVASLKSGRQPGTYNHYVSMDTQVIGMVLREATGKSLSAYLEEKIWKKIGMEADAYWLIDSEGMELAFGGFNVILRDYARFGQLYLNQGRWNGEQVVPADWVRASVTPDAPHLMPGKNEASSWVLGYGYQWWIPENPEDDYLAIGIFNQFIYVHPKYNVVIAKTSAYPDYYKDGDDKEIETIAVFRAIAENLKP